MHEDLTYTKSSLGMSDNSTGNNEVLDVGWNIQSGTFQFSLSDKAKRGRSLVASKWNILSVFASIYDPLAIHSPVAVTIKIVIQELFEEATVGIVKLMIRSGNVGLIGSERLKLQTKLLCLEMFMET